MLFQFHRKKYCLVLGGGGTKGIYEIGVWKALREIGIPIEAVIGTSIGALNGLWIAQNDFEQAEKTWDQLSLDKVLRLPQQFDPPPAGTEDWKTLDLLWRVYRRKGMLDNSPLRNLIESQFQPLKIRNSGIDYGIVTFNINRMSAEVVFAREIGPESLVDYLMASSTFPGFNLTTIRKQAYLDGGLANNVPYEIARARGYRRLVVVDVGGIGVRHPIEPWGTESVFIRNSERLGHVLEFRREFLQKAKIMGYLDTLKAFSKYEGEKFYLEPHSSWYREWNVILESETFYASLPQNLRDWKKSLPHQFRYYKNPTRYLMEIAAEALGIERLRVYSPQELTAAVMSAYAAILRKLENNDFADYQGFVGALRSEWKKFDILPGLGRKAPLEVDLVLRKMGFEQLHPWVFDVLLRLYPDLVAAKVFLYLAARWSKKFPAPRFSFASLQNRTR